MTTASEVFITTDLVGMDKGLHTISVFEDWQASYDNEPLGLTPSAALCLSALLSLRDRLTTTVDRDEAILQLHNEANARGMQATEFYVRDSLQHHDRIRRSSESLLLRKTSRLYPYLYSLGNIGAKRILFCSNVQVIDGGMKAIETLYPDDENLEQREQLSKEFLKEYRYRESINLKGTDITVKTSEKSNLGDNTTNQTLKRLPDQKPVIPDTKEAVKTKKPKQEKFKPAIDSQEQRDYIAEVRSKFSPIAEYLDLAKSYIYDTSIGDKISKIEIEEYITAQGYVPNPADIDVLLLEFSKGGVIKKTYDYQENRQVEVVFVRFNKE